MNLNKYIGIPYKDLGRDLDGLDCFGLVYCIFRYERNITLPDYTELKYSRGWYKTENHIIDNINDDWKDVDKPYRLYDSLIFYNIGHNYGIANHIGMYIDNNKFIHILEDQTSSINRLDQFWSSKLYKVMRFIG